MCHISSTYNRQVVIRDTNLSVGGGWNSLSRKYKKEMRGPTLFLCNSNEIEVVVVLGEFNPMNTHWSLLYSIIIIKCSPFLSHLRISITVPLYST